jgi:hypothetical protein
MKSIFFLFISVVLLVGGSVKAQTADVTFKSDEFRKSYTNILDGDTIKGTAEIGKTFLVNKPFQYVYLYQMAAVKTVDGGSLDMIVSGSVDGVKYYPLDTINWKMVTADTAVLFNVTTATNWTLLKGSIKGIGATTRAKLGNQYLKLAEYK